MSPISHQEAEYMSSPLCDDVFSRWMIMHSLVQVHEDPPALIDVFYQDHISQARPVKQTELQFLRILESRSAMIMPHRQIADHLRQESEMRDSIKDWMRVNQLGSQIRRRDASIVYYAQLLGWGLGVQDFRLSATAVPIIYFLWLNQGSEFEDRDLSNQIYRVADSDAVLFLQQQIDLINQTQLSFSDVEISESTHQVQHAYTLVDHVQKSRRRESADMDVYNERAFQDFLFSLGLIDRIPFRLDAKRSLNTQTKEYTLMQSLMNNSGYLMPYTYLSEHLYASERNEMVKIGRMVTELKMKQVIHPSDVFVVPGYGIGLGICSVDFTTKQMQLLRLLWHGDAYSSEQILSSLWGMYQPHDSSELDKVRTLIDTTRTLLSRSPYTIMRSGDWRKYRYSLQEDQE